MKDHESAKEEQQEYGGIKEEEEVNVDAFGAGIVDSIVSLEDDETLPVLTLRSLLLGVSLGIFGGLLAQIYIFKPQAASVSILFLVIVAYTMGKGMEWLGFIIVEILRLHKGSYASRMIYPGPFNIKEHCALIIIGSSAAASAQATQLIATADLYYKPLAWYHSIILVLSSQCLGYGIAGIFRSTLVYPEKTFYPSTLSTISVYDTLHNSSGAITKSRLQLFGGIALVMCVYEWIPLYIAPTVTAVSFFCLFNQKANSFTRMFGGERVNKGGYGMFTNIFGGSTNNEGLGLFALCFDWNLIGNYCLTLPWSTQVSSMIGTLVCVTALPIMYYLDVWKAQSFPFLSQMLFAIDGSPYNQTIILDENNALNRTAYEDYGAPYFSPSWVFGLLCVNASLTAGIVHICLFNWDIIVESYRTLFSSSSSSSGKSSNNVGKYQRVMEKYPEVPHWAYFAVLATSIAGALFVIIDTKAGLPILSFAIAIIIASLLTFVSGFLYGTTGFQVNVQPLVQMLGGFMNPGNPVANQYFTLFGYNSILQATTMLTDLKIGQYMKIPPRIILFCQMLGTCIGGICNYVMTTSIVSNNAEVLKSSNGNNQWSGYSIQDFNSQSITWGALPYELYAPGKIYFPVLLALPFGLLLPLPCYFLHKAFPKLGFNLVNMSVLMWYCQYLTVGVNSSIMSSFIIGFCSQYLMRKYRPKWFSNYNYIVSAGLDAGVQISVFIISMSVLGAAGDAIPFPNWALYPEGNPDYCPAQPASDSGVES